MPGAYQGVRFLRFILYAPYVHTCIRFRVCLRPIASCQTRVGTGMNIVIKKMSSDAEIRGKAYVHWKAWQEAYPGIVAQSYLDRLTLKKCESIAYQWPDNILVAKDGENVVDFVGYGKYRNSELPNTGEVYAIYVLKRYYGQGVGALLMREALKQLSDYPQVAV